MCIFLFFLLFTNEWSEMLVNSFHFEWAAAVKRIASERERERIKRNYLNMCWRWIILIRQVNVESTQFTCNIFFHFFSLLLFLRFTVHVKSLNVIIFPLSPPLRSLKSASTSFSSCPNLPDDDFLLRVLFVGKNVERKKLFSNNIFLHTILFRLSICAF